MHTSKYTKINDETNEWKFQYYLNGKELIVKEIDSENNKIAKLLCGYFLIKKDLNVILTWAEELGILLEQLPIKDDDHRDTKFIMIPNEYKGMEDKLFTLFCSITIIYGRLFTSNTSRRVSLTKKEHILPQYLEVHNQLLLYRHDYIAHSSDRMHEESKAYIIINPENPSEFIIHTESISTKFPQSKENDKIIDHVINLLDIINKKIDVFAITLTKEHQTKKLKFKYKD